MNVENQKPNNEVEKKAETTEKTIEPKDKTVPEVKTPEPTKEQNPEEKKEAAKDSKDPEPSAEAKVDVEALKKQLAEAIETGKQVDTLNATVNTLQTEIEAKNNVIKEYEGLLQNLVDTKMEQIPDQYKDLVPDNMDLKQKLSWLEKAESKGLFNKEDKQNPAIEVGKPMNVEVPKVDTSKLNASSLLSLAYNTIRK